MASPSAGRKRQQPGDFVETPQNWWLWRKIQQVAPHCSSLEHGEVIPPGRRHRTTVGHGPTTASRTWERRVLLVSQVADLTPGTSQEMQGMNVRPPQKFHESDRSAQYNAPKLPMSPAIAPRYLHIRAPRPNTAESSPAANNCHRKLERPSQPARQSRHPEALEGWGEWRRWAALDSGKDVSDSERDIEHPP